MKKLSLIIAFLFACVAVFCQIDTSALHNVVAMIPKADQYWPIATKIFGGVATLLVIISELLPFLPTKANGIVQGIMIALKAIRPKDSTGTTPTQSNTVKPNDVGVGPIKP